MSTQKIFITTTNNHFTLETLHAGQALDLAGALQVHQNIMDPFLTEIAKNHGIKLYGALKIYISTPAGLGEVQKTETQVLFSPFSPDSTWSVIGTKAKQVQIIVNSDGSISFAE